MMLTGFCVDCRKIKHVRVTNAGMVRLAQGGVASGQCSACADAEEKARRDRWEARRAR